MPREKLKRVDLHLDPTLYLRLVRSALANERTVSGQIRVLLVDALIDDETLRRLKR